VKALDIRWEYHMAPTLFGNSWKNESDFKKAPD
jgi:hypothetical protein